MGGYYSVQVSKGIAELHLLINVCMGLKSIDECTEHGHNTRPILLKDEESDSEDGEHSQVHIDYDQKPYYELAGHPLPCSDNNSMCQSRLRVLRAAAPHFPQLHKFLFLLYNAIREHRPLDSIIQPYVLGILTSFAKSVASQTTHV